MHTIKMRIRGAEFEASGEEAAVNEQFAAFMKVAASLPDENAGAKKLGGTQGTDNGKPGKDPAESEGDDADLDGLCKRTFRVDGDTISLNALPQGDSATFDAVVLLLYASDRLRGEANVMVSAIINGLKQSGVQDQNVGKETAGRAALVTKAGIKRGTRYGLTNRGRQYAEEVLRKLA